MKRHMAEIRERRAAAETTTDNVIGLPRMRRIGEITREIIEWLEQGEGFKE